VRQRREFITLLGGAAAWPLAARAQPGERIRRIGVLTGSAENDPQYQLWFDTFREGLTKLGWIEGRNLRTDFRFGADDPDRVRAYAADLVSTNPEVIVAVTGAGLSAAQEQTRTIPIVLVVAGDVAGGAVKNLARPEGNVTGVTNYFASLGNRWLELMKDAVPTLARVGAIYTRSDNFVVEAEKAARLFGMQITRIPTHDGLEIVRAIDAFAAEPNGGLMVLPQTPIPEVRKIILQLARQYRLPTLYPSGLNVAHEGGLMAYGPVIDELFGRVPFYVDRLLRGAKVNELPVEYPTKFELVINLKTAKAIGLTIPESFLVRADRVIE
jgi:putative ABC transport system substrate-binding protein